MKYVYFVSYDYRDGINQGAGNICYALNYAISNIDDIRKIEAKIMEINSFSHVVINNYILMRTE